MTGLGVLGEVRPADSFDPDAVMPARPGGEAPSTLVTSNRHPSSPDSGDLVTEAAEIALGKAMRAAQEAPSSTTMAALAQNYAALNERDEAIEAARRAIDLSLTSAAHGVCVADPVSLRLAAEVLLRFGEERNAYDVLQGVPRTRSLQLMFAVLAFQAGHADLALNELKDVQHPLAEAIQGYVLTSIGEYQKAVGHLRAALREQPEDPDSLLNLSISLWHLGARRKATAAALRATRVTPGRKDVSLHYLNLLLDQEEIARVDAEVRLLKSNDVVEDADLLVVQARAFMTKGQNERAISMMRAAAEAAEREGKRAVLGEVLGNLAVLKYETGRVSYADTVKRLEELIQEFKGCGSLVVHYARFAGAASQAPLLRSAIRNVESTIPRLWLAYLHHQIALLEGDNSAAAEAARDWFVHEPDNPMAAAAAIVALGIGVERWAEASAIARDAVERFPSDETVVNNAAYVLAMAGNAEEAIRLLEPIADDDFIMNATLGLAYLAAGDLGEGMRLYREAAASAEKVDPLWRSLMTSYQALVVRQLGLLDSEPENVIAALALPQVSPPSDWANRPEFLRLWNVATRNGYGWPLAV